VCEYGYSGCEKVHTQVNVEVCVCVCVCVCVVGENLSGRGVRKSVVGNLNKHS
jgi:hypothetical protein